MSRRMCTPFATELVLSLVTVLAMLSFGVDNALQ